MTVAAEDLSIQFGEDTGGIQNVSAFGGAIGIHAADPAAPRLFSFTLKDADASVDFSNLDAETFSFEEVCSGKELRFEYRGFLGHDIRVVAGIRAEDTDITWTIEVVNNSGHSLTRVGYPLIGAYTGLTGNASEDCIVLPVGEGRLYRDPARIAGRPGELTGNCYPGDHSMQFTAIYHRDGPGLYLGCRDCGGLTKKLALDPQQDGLCLGARFYLEESEAESFRPEFDVVLRPFIGDWRDAAAIYREWAEEQWWCEKKLPAREDIPKWFTSGRPIISIENYATTGGTAEEHFRHSLDQVHEWERTYCRELGPCVFFWTGWEHDGAWISPELFPPLEGDQPFDSAVEATHAMGAKLEAYFSTVLFIVKHGKRSSLLEEEGLGAAVLTGDGRRDRFDRWWGSSTAMCLSSEWWRSRIIATVESLTRRGFDMVQLDMFPINAPRPCWDPAHGHPKGYGAWHMRAGIDVIEACRTAGRRINPDVVISTEMPCETYIPYIDTYLSRDDWRDLEAPEKRSEYTAIPLFSFVYHEFALTQGYEWSMIVLPSMKDTIALQFVRGKVPTAFEGWGAWDPTWEAPSEQERESNRKLAWRLLRLTCRAASGFAHGVFHGGRTLKPPAARFSTAQGTAELGWDSTAPALGAFTARDATYVLILNAGRIPGVLEIEPNQKIPGKRTALCTWINGAVRQEREVDSTVALELELNAFDVVILRFS